MGRSIGAIALALVFTAAGFVLGRTQLGDPLVEAARSVQRSAVGAVADRAGLDMRTRTLLENPDVMARIADIGGFGGSFSPEVAQNMFGRTEAAIADAKKLTDVIEVAPRTWLVRFPIVNAVLFETDAGLVVVDTGMAPKHLEFLVRFGPVRLATTLTLVGKSTAAPPS